MKKRLIAIVLACATVILLSAGATVALASDFGSGAEVIAENEEMVKSGLFGKRIDFTDGDFKSAMAVADFESITVTRIPPSSEGVLMLDGRRVGVGKVITRREIGGLSFIPSGEAIPESGFSFTVNGLSGVEIDCRLRYTDRINYAPSTEGHSSESSVRTQESVSVYGRMYGKDPEGDALVYRVIAYPKSGSLEVTDSETGAYRYTPTEGYVGEDKFVYVVRDEYGNYSYPVTVRLEVNERMSPTKYADMDLRSEYNAALAMTAIGVMNGRLVGDGMYFMPDEEVTRAEFLAMAMKSVGISPDRVGTKTVFDDDADIPEALRGYVSKAARLGIVGGDFEGGRLVFAPREAITKYEAARIMSSVLGLEISEEDEEYEDTSVPVYARGSVSVMYTLGVFDEGDGEDMTECVSRADAASYLYRLLLYSEI